MDLLDEIWMMIFEDLNTVEIVKLREVSKRFKFLIDTMCFKKLTICDYDSIHFYSLGYQYKSPYGPMLQLYRFNLLSNSSFQLVFANLKVLLMGCNLGLDFNLESLNEFSKLENLSIRSVTLPEKSQVLKLPNLKTLLIDLNVPLVWKTVANGLKKWVKKWQAWVVLDSKVTKLHCSGFTHVKLIYPDSIEHLMVSEWDLPLKEKFNSLKKFQIMNFAGLRPEAYEAYRDVLDISDILEEFYLDSINNSDPLRQVANELLVRALKKNIKFYVSNIHLTEPFEELPSITRERHVNLTSVKVQILCYHKLATRVYDTCQFNYESLISFLNDQRATLIGNQVSLDDHQFPVDFFQKIHVKEFSVYRIEDENLFVWFLRKSAGLMRIDFMGGCLSQTILNQLPVVCGRSMKSINIDADNDGPELDYEPLCKLPEIFYLSLDKLRNIDLKIVTKFLQNCKYLTHLSCLSNEAYLGLKKSSEKHYSLGYFPKKEDVSSFKMEELDMEKLRKVLEEIINHQSSIKHK